MSSESAVGATGIRSLGAWSLVCGIISLVGVMMIGQASFDWIPTFDPAGWLRVVTGWMLPIGALAGLFFGTLSVRRRSGRGLGWAGMALAVISVFIFVAMLVASPY